MMRTHLTQRVAASFGLAAAFRFSSTGAKLPSELFAAPHDAYARRHIGPTPQETRDMLAAIDPSLQTVDQLMDRVVPKNIRRTPMTDVAAMTEAEALSNLRRLMMRNKLRKSLLGQGYYEALVPPAIQRNVLENPAWYTPYTPYQAEISQGRLESLLNFQTAVMDLTGMTIANSSLLDEATAAVEAIISSLNLLKSKRSKREKIFVDKRCFEATIEMIRTRVHNIYAQVVVGDLATELDVNDENLAVVMVQTPDRFGAVHDFSALFEKVKANGGMACCGTDLLACSLIKPPGEMGADFVFGNAQRLGVPLGFGGPHPAFFAAREAHKRFLPGRLVGVSIDSKGRRALRLALQTREQHIKRQNATSNICTAQALLANMAAMYCVYHGPDGLKEIATRVHEAARTYALGMEVAGHTVLNRDTFFDTITVKLDDAITADEYLARCEDRRINVWRVSANTVTVAFDEATTNEHLIALLECGGIVRPRLEAITEQAATRGGQTGIPEGLKRTSKYLTQDVFHKNRCETELMRYIWRLCRKDYGLEHGMVPLGSCTMKLNPAASMLPMSWQRVTALHPFVPADQAEGYKILAVELSEKLKMVSGLDAVSLQPNSGAQGEYAGLRVIRAFQASIGEGSRDIALIPANAHGTNPASAALCGLKCVIVKCLPDGSIDMAHLQQLCDKHKSEISCAMITYPSTYGIFDNQISTITSMVHSIGAQVYIDGANFNAMVGHTGPGFFGGDVCHFNLHKTFSIPHGGGGPGMGPIACKEHLAPFLPDCVHSHALNVGGANAFGQCSQGPLGSAAILTISYMLISMLGTAGMKQCTDFAVLAANYMMSALKEDYSVRFLAKDSGLCAHEFILDMAPFGKVDIKAEDVAKRLMDYGFHAPTLAFPVNNTLMVEPTESEPKAELDRFVTAMKSIRREIRLIEEGKLPKDLNMLKLAPHPADDVISSKWDLPYTREQAAFPVGTEAQLGVPKYWPMTSRINNEHGDQNLFCSCAPVTPAE